MSGAGATDMAGISIGMMIGRYCFLFLRLDTTVYRYAFLFFIVNLFVAVSEFSYGLLGSCLNAMRVIQCSVPMTHTLAINCPPCEPPKPNNGTRD
jgi:hypothetical protein